MARRGMPWVVLAVCLVGGGLLAAGGPGLVELTPAAADGRLVCRLRTAGLPDSRQLQSMQSGLVAAVEVDVAMVDEADELRGGRSVSLRLAFDLWDEVYSVTTERGVVRFDSLPDLEAHLQDGLAIDIAPLEELADDGTYRLRAVLVAHAVAPDERERVTDAIVGETRRERGGQDRQEASVSLGRLIRLFYRGGNEAAGGREMVSAPFKREGVTHATH